MNLTLRLRAAIGLGVLTLVLVAVSPPGRRALSDLGVDVGGDAAPAADWSWPFGRRHRLHHKVWGTRTGERERGFWASAGQTMRIDSRVQLEALSIVLVRHGLPVTILWSTRFEQSESATTTIQLPETGNYDLVVRMISFGGEYEVRWTIEQPAARHAPDALAGLLTPR